ncbi:hypothetical protein H0H93_000775 [Arthromyces matolae]|nr:hypothetical protein H0H93_000775 [Arthromyces matolae]
MRFVSALVAAFLPLIVTGSSTVTIYRPIESGAPVEVVSEFMTLQAIGTATNGATTYAVELVESVYIDKFNRPSYTTSNGIQETISSTFTTTVTLPTPTTYFETIVQDATHWVYSKDPQASQTPEDTIGEVLECSFDGLTNATCVLIGWNEDSTTTQSTITQTVTGVTMTPWYTLVVSDTKKGNGAALISGPGTVGWGLISFGLFSAWIIPL